MPKKLGKFRITQTPKGAKHGLVTFHLKGKGASNIRWYVDTRRAGAKRQTWEWTTGNGRHYFIYLWAQQRWGEHLWGRHTIEAKFTVKDSCGTARAVACRSSTSTTTRCRTTRSSRTSADRRPHHTAAGLSAGRGV